MAEDIGSLVVRIEANLKNFDSGINNVSKKMDAFGSSVKKIGGIIAGAFAVKALVGFGKQMIMTASDAAEMQSKFNTVFDNMSKDAEDWSSDFQKRVGGSRVEIKGMIADSQDMLTSFGATTEQAFDFSTKMQSLGTDLASFQNISGGAEEAVNRLRKGLLGETENLKAMGIVINENIMNQELATRGDKRKIQELSELEKIELRYAIAVKQSKNAIGDAEKTAGGFANQMRNLKGQVKDTTARLGAGLLPIATKVITFINSQIPNMEAFFTNAFQKISSVISPIYETVMPLLQQGFQYFSDNIIPLFQGRMNVLSNTVIPLLMDVFNNLMTKVMPPLQRIFNVFIEDVFPKLNDAMIFFAENVYPIIAEAFNYIVDNVLPPVIKIIEYLATEIVPMLAEKFQEWVPIIVDIMKGLWDVIKVVIDLIVKAFEWAWPYLKDIVSGAINVIGDVISGLLKALKGVIDFIAGVFTGDWQRAWDGIKNIFSGIWQAIKSILVGAKDLIVNIVKNLIIGISNVLTNANKKLTEIGKNLIQGFINGMKSKISKAIETVKNMGEKVLDGLRNIFNIHSPSRVTEKIGKFVALGLAEGIKDSAYKVEDEAQALADMAIGVFDKMGNAITKALKDKYRLQQSLALSNYDEETRSKIEAVQNQIDAINNLTDAEEDALKEQEYQEKLSALEREIATEKDAKTKADLLVEKADMIANYERKKLLEQREQRKSTLEQQIRDIETNAEKERKLKEEQFNKLLEEESIQAETRKLIVQGNNDEIVKLLEEYYPDWQNAGQGFGESLINGLNSTKASIKEAVNSITSLISEEPIDASKKFASYIVKAGDTLSKIAEKFGTTVKAIAEASGITNVNLIRTGQELKIPKLATGTNLVPFDTAAFIHKGEAVIPADNNPSNPNATNPIGNTINYEGMFNGAIFNVRSDMDIKLIAREIYNLQQSRSRGNGVIAT